jgi:hypothetical protein
MLLYISVIILIAIICFLVLMFPFIEPAIRGLPAEDMSSPGAGILVMVYIMVSGLAGLLGAVPFALFTEYLIVRRPKDENLDIRRTTHLFGL